MLSTSLTISDDNKVVTFIRIYFDEAIYKITTIEDEEILPDYKKRLFADNEIILSTEWDNPEKGLTYNEAVELKIPRYIKNDYLSGFFNSLYPNEGQSDWYNRKVEIGLGWQNDPELNENRIFWIYSGYIKSYSYDPNYLTFKVDFSLRDIEVPTEKFTKQEFPNIPEDNENKVKPIVFGRLDYSFLYFDDGVGDKIVNIHQLAPAVLVDSVNATFYISQLPGYVTPDLKRLNSGTTFVQFNHIVYYDNNNDCCIAFINQQITGGAEVNNNNRYTIRLINANGTNQLKVYFKYKPRAPGKYTNNVAKKLLERIAGGETYFIEAYQELSFKIDDFENNIYGNYVLNQLRLVLHTTTPNQQIRFAVYNKNTNNIEDIFDTTTSSPKTFHTIFPSKFNKNCEIYIQSRQTQYPFYPIYVRNIYIIGFDISHNNQGLLLE